jgi:hypothetical protein
MKSGLRLLAELLAFSVWLGTLGLLAVFFCAEGLVTRLLGGPTCDSCGYRRGRHAYNCIDNPGN